MSLSTPTQIEVPFADLGTRTAIPAAANNTTGRAGYDLGFPPINSTPKVAGGIPPFGSDMNGILYDITVAEQFIQAGGSWPYDSGFATAIGGYPLGALVQRSDGSGFWRNTLSGNTTDPDAGGANWQPEESGITPVTMTSSNVTLTSLQAAKNIIVITGTLTTNLNLIFPTYTKNWTVSNQTTGAFAITCKTAAGSGVIVPQNASTPIWGDGTNINFAANAAEFVLRGYIDGLIMSTAGSSTTMTVASGQATDSTSSANLSLLSSIAKTTSAWAVGSGNGGLDTGTIANSTWYYFYVIRRPDTGVVDVVFSTNSSTPTLPTNYTQYRYIGGGLTNGSGQWTRFYQYGDEFVWDTPPTDASTNATTTPTLYTLSVPRRTGIKASISAFANKSGNNAVDLKVYNPSIAAVASSISSAATTLSYTTDATAALARMCVPVSCITNTSGQVMVVSASTTAFELRTTGWVDGRGKN